MIKHLLAKYPLLEQGIILLGNSVLITVAVYCTFGAVLSAFSIDVDMGILLIIWLPCAIVTSALAMRYRVKGLLIFLPLVLVPLFLNRAEVLEEAKWVIHEITRLFSLWLASPVLFPESAEFAGSPTFFIALVGIAVTLLLAFAICLRRSTFFTIIFTAPIVFLTFSIYAYISDIAYLLGLIAVYLTVFLSSSYSPDDFHKRGLLFAPAFVLAAALMFIAYLIAPHGGYVRDIRTIEFGNRVRMNASQMQHWGHLWNLNMSALSRLNWLQLQGSGLWQFNTENLNIADSGEMTFSNQSLLEITVGAGGTFYIRGYAMQHFDGRTWSAAGEAESIADSAARGMPAQIAEFYNNTLILQNREESAVPQVSMSIKRTGDMTNVDYEPYFSEVSLSGRNGIELFSDGFDHVSSFFYIQNSVHGIFDEIRDILDYRSALTAYSDELLSSGIYTQIDDHTAGALRQIAIESGIDPYAERTIIADTVASYIRSAASYTHSPGAIPEDEDFAIYFLQTLREGYCIHFATAAVLMLRALDIPARFASGYVVTVPGYSIGESIVLTDKNAHAWVEVFYEDVGWLYLEVTPSSALSAIPEARPHNPGGNFQELQTPTPLPIEPTLSPALPERETPGNIDSPTISQGDESGDLDKSAQALTEWLLNIGIIATCAVLCFVVIVLRSHMERKHREKQFKQEDTNAAIICMWQYIQRLCGSKVSTSEAVEGLALKARFSQHRISEGEREKMMEFASQLALKMYTSKGKAGRIWFKYVLGRL